MTKTYYAKKNKKNIKIIFRILSLSMVCGGFLLIAYIFFPLISWQIYFAPVFASQNIESPIPETTIVSGASIGSLISSAAQTFSGIDYDNAQNWYPSTSFKGNSAPKVTLYTIAIPKLQITSALVSTVDTNLAAHLVNFAGTAVPPDRGNAVIFGHSTLPQLFDPNNYKTILADAYKLSDGDVFIVSVNNKRYTYVIQSIIVVEPDDTSVFTQSYDASYITLITCTPPGTIWKRLVIRAKLDTIN